MDFLKETKPSERRVWLVVFILLGFLLLGAIYNNFIPPFEGPDEAQHFAYVVWLATNMELPPQGKDAWNTQMEQEASQPPFYYLLASLPLRFANLTEVGALYLPNPHYPPPLPHPFPDNENRALHHINAISLDGKWNGFYTARGITRFFGLLLLVCVYGLGRQIVPTKPTIALGATLLTATMPQVVFLSTMVSNDVPAAALSTMTLWLFAILLRRNRQRPFQSLSFFTGILLGLAGLTKVSTLGLIIPLMGGFVWVWRSGRWPLKRMVLSGLWLGIGTTAVSAWWFIHNWITYRSPIGLDTHDYAPWSLSNEGVLASMGERWIEIIRSFWIALGWGALRPDDWAYTILFVLGILALVGLAVLFIKAWQTRRQEDSLTLVLVGILLLTVLIMSLLLEFWMRQVVAVHGRLLFPALGAIAILLVLGWERLHPKLPLLAYGYTLAWVLIIPLGFLKPAYTPHYLPESEATTVPSILGWHMLEDGVPILELKQVNLPATAVAGELLPVELCWQALAETQIDYSFLVQLIGPENSLIASRRTYPGHGLIPTSDWLVGSTVCETTHILIPENLGQTLLYQVETAFIDHKTETRLPVTNSENLPIFPTFSAHIKLETNETNPIKNLSAEAPMQLISSEFAPIWTSGKQADIHLSWAIPALLAKDYQVFVHLRDDNGQTIAQADGPPLAGWYPTSQWSPGEIVIDSRVFPVPADLPASTYTLVVGFYDIDTGERLGTEFVMGQIEVKNAVSGE